jgi:uncharacterized DUF497 family protein
LALRSRPVEDALWASSVELMARPRDQKTLWRAVLLLYIRMCYEWDEEKNRLNQEKHGISFEIAALVFEDERCLVRTDRTDEMGEQRWQAIGAARIDPDAAIVLLVVHVYREETHGEEITRIISARKAEKNDIRRYQEQEME